MTRTSYLIAATALVALPLMAGTSLAQRASKPGAVENTESAPGRPGSSSEAPARSMRPQSAPDAAKPSPPAAATGAPKKGEEKKGEDKKK